MAKDTGTSLKQRMAILLSKNSSPAIIIIEILKQFDVSHN